jgi:hypothetical protein
VWSGDDRRSSFCPFAAVLLCCCTIVGFHIVATIDSISLYPVPRLRRVNRSEIPAPILCITKYVRGDEVKPGAPSCKSKVGKAPIGENDKLIPFTFERVLCPAFDQILVDHRLRSTNSYVFSKGTGWFATFLYFLVVI